ncbi:GntR family transcriptional regulator [Chelatococcus sp. GCM10030263]|uniref:GntR family transcriptional regulator n=1 Tax=Chelatococcus sp. GCM10030263 TaxID=3273387 RepID=UPI00361B97CA
MTSNAPADSDFYAGQDLFEGRRPRSLTSAIFDRLRTDILTCRLTPGEKLPVAALAQAFNVSLAAVREALSRLVADGLVLAEDQRGFRVSPISEADLEDLTRTRIEIEALALRKSLEEGGDAWIADVRKAWDDLRNVDYMDPADPTRHNENWNLLHDRFHRTLTQACGMVWLLRFRDSLHEQSERYRRLARPAGLFTRDPYSEHENIAKAVFCRDVDTAALLLKEHFTKTMELVRAAGKAENSRFHLPVNSELPERKRRKPMRE